jgi:hypothetical protein
MIERYRLIILGASFYGCGLAAAHPGALLIEPAILVGSDFALSYFPGTVPRQRLSGKNSPHAERCTTSDCIWPPSARC